LLSKPEPEPYFLFFFMQSSLLVSYTANEFLEEYVPTVSSVYSGTVMIKNQPYDCLLADTGGQEDYDLLRSLVYPQTECLPDLLLNCESSQP
jgi:GTPase SAR1 family protein